MTRTTTGSRSGDRTAPAKRPVGRPKLRIDPDEVAAVAIRLYDEHGFDAVSIEAVAEGLDVSRATLYRTVRSLDELHNILLERILSTVENRAGKILSAHDEPGTALIALIRFQIDASVRMRNYVGVYFGWGLSPEVYDKWRSWAGGYEQLWTEAVTSAVEAGYLESDDVRTTTRLILGMVNWVSRWYSSASGPTPDDIANSAIKLVLPNWSGPTPDSSAS